MIDITGQTVPSLELTLDADEVALLQTINFSNAPFKSSDDAKANGLASVKLMKSLLARDAIPEWRLRYFSDPAFNSGGHGRSDEQIFIRNGCTTQEKLFAHPHFLKVLKYFLKGPDLSLSIIEEWRAAAADCGTITSGDLAPLTKLARRLARDQGLNGKTAAEEFYKLALECGLDADQAWSIRDGVRTI